MPRYLHVLRAPDRGCRRTDSTTDDVRGHWTGGARAVIGPRPGRERERERSWTRETYDPPRQPSGAGGRRDKVEVNAALVPHFHPSSFLPSHRRMAAPLQSHQVRAPTPACLPRQTNAPSCSEDVGTSNERDPWWCRRIACRMASPAATEKCRLRSRLFHPGKGFPLGGRVKGFPGRDP